MEYNRNFQDNISAHEFNQKANGIANWIEENRELHDWAQEPNAYEMTNVFLFAGKHIADGNDIDLDGIKRIWKLRSQDFEKCGISENHFVYQICKQSYDSAISEQALVNDENSHNALRKMASIGLYLVQQKREKGTVEYNNLNELITLIEDSKMLKVTHPELYEAFRFDDNLSVMYKLQQTHLDKQARTALDNAYNNNSSKQDKSDVDFLDDGR